VREKGKRKREKGKGYGVETLVPVFRFKLQKNHLETKSIEGLFFLSLIYLRIFLQYGSKKIRTNCTVPISPARMDRY
jgi:hypothetical protein